MPVWKLRIAGIGAALAVFGSAVAQTPSETPFQKQTPELNAGANSFAQGQARALLESKGYSEISPLVNGSDGIWRGTASRDGKTVDVSIDFQGHVVAR